LILGSLLQECLTVFEKKPRFREFCMVFEV